MITTHCGKMTNIRSLSVSSSSKFCEKMQKKKGYICQYCYAKRFEAFRPDTKAKLLRNLKALSSETILLPKLNDRFFRFNSFGELQNKRHLDNYVQMARKNKGTVFTLWTKRSRLIMSYFMANDKPKNLIVVYSSLKINRREEIPFGCDKVFTVYEREFAEKNKIKINCEARCFECLKCYSKKGPRYINEILIKGGGRK